MVGEPFYFRNNRHASTLQEFKIILGMMPDDEFESHCNANKNDFAEWIEHSLLKPELASEVRPLRSRQRILEVITDDIDGKKNEPWRVKGWFMGPKNGMVHEEMVKEVAEIESKPQENARELIPQYNKKSEKTLTEEAKEIERFATREFVYGVILGFLIGLILMAVLVQLKMLPY